MCQLKWGIIGCGNVTEVKSGPAFNKVEGSRLVAVMRRDAKKARDYAQRHHIPSWYSRADDLIDDPEVNAVYIATPPSSHAEYAIRTLEKGKVAYVEKPMAAGYADCIAMHHASLRTGIPLYVAYYRRFLPYFIAVKGFLDSGQLGELLYAKIDFHIPPRQEDYHPDDLPWRVKPEIAGAGYFYDLACHQLDLFDWFFGPVKAVSGRNFNRRHLYSAEDVVMAQLEYASGLPVTCSWCFVAGENQSTDMIRVFGTKAVLECSTFAFTPIRLIGQDGVTEQLPPNPENIQYGLIRHITQELLHEKPVTGNSEAAMRSNWLMDKILGRI